MEDGPLMHYPCHSESNIGFKKKKYNKMTEYIYIYIYN